MYQYNYDGFANMAFEATEDPWLQQIWAGTQWIQSFSKTFEAVSRREAVFIDYYSYLEPVTKTAYSNR